MVNISVAAIMMNKGKKNKKLTKIKEIEKL